MLWARITLGELVYGRCGPRTVRTGPHTLIKFGSSVDESEAEAMQFIADNTSVPVPKVIRVHKYNITTFIEMKFVPGKEGHVWFTMSRPAQQALVKELESYLRQIRSLTPPTPGLVASAYGNACLDHRFGVNSAGPFSNHKEFHRFLRMDEDLGEWDTERNNIVVQSHRLHYRSNFAHGDLAPRNVLIHKGRISAVIDWDCAGWRPEYWDVTKSRYSGVGTPKEWLEAIDRASGSSYDLQLKAEIRLWSAAEFPSSPGVYRVGSDGVAAHEDATT